MSAFEQDTEAKPAESIATLATQIVLALLAKEAVEPERLPSLIREVRAALAGGTPMPEGVDALLGMAHAAKSPQTPPSAARPEAASAQQPAVPIAESITPDYLVSLEDGQPYRSLKRHLMAKYGMTPDEYRRKWGLPHDYPMVAPSYAQERSEVARRIGLGRSGRRARAKERKSRT